MFRIKEINDKKTWSSFFLRKEIEYFPFFQSWNYGEVQKKLGYNLFRYGLWENNTLLGVFSIAEISARRGHYFHLRHGPVLLKYEERYLSSIFNYIKKFAKEKKISFLRVSPLIIKNSKKETFFKKWGFINSPMHNMDAETCLILNVEKTEEQLLKEMRKTHRYLIRKALNMNINTIRTTKMSDLLIFKDLYKDLYSRKHFTPHRDIDEEFEIFSKDKEAILLLAEYDENIIAGALIDFVGNMGVYHHAASLDAYKNIPASYLLQWEAIKETKKRGKKYYNFWGVVSPDKPNHPWKGLTLFKTGFGGERVDFVHARDLPLNFMYWKTFLIETALRLQKGY